VVIGTTFEDYQAVGGSTPGGIDIATTISSRRK
jgi:hypothetical protein